MIDVLVQTTLHGTKALKKIIRAGKIGTNSNPQGSQVPRFKDKPLVYCSYFCEGYSEMYGDRDGIVFETDTPPVYACPTDTFGLLRGGNWLPGHERYIFSSIEDMLEKYPTQTDFRIDFHEFFKTLKPEEVYPDNDKEFAERLYENDYCLRSQWQIGYNEITFPKPLKIKNPRIFSSKAELANL